MTPGQGQTVRVSGVQVGEVGKVKLKNGMAVVQMDIDTKYRNLIHEDGQRLLRPKTGLDDMFLEVEPRPGGSNAPVAPPGYTIPVSNTNPPVDPDEILSSLDADTRAYLELLINGAGQGFRAGWQRAGARCSSASCRPTGPGRAELGGGRARSRAALADPFASRAERGGRGQAGSDRPADRRELEGVRGVRQRQPERQPGRGGPAGHAAAGDGDAPEGAALREDRRARVPRT